VTEAPSSVIEQAKYAYDLIVGELESSGSMLPRAVIVGEKDLAIVVSPFVGSSEEEVDREKNNFSIYVKVRAIADRAEEVMYLSEAWIVTFDPSDTEGYAQFLEWRKTHWSFSEHPDRKEVATIHIETREGMLLASFEQRRESAERSTLVPFEEGNKTWTPAGAERKFTGRMSAFLPPKQIIDDEEIVDQARTFLELLEKTGPFKSQLVEKPTFH
jgi:hypothetical protein